MKHWKTEATEYLVENRWVTLRADKCLTADNVAVDPYYVLEHTDWVHIIAFDKQGRILVTKQYRHPVGTVCLEIPGGEMEPGETPLEAAKRELLEETGCTADHFEPFPSFFPNPARQTNKVHNFLVRDVVQVSEQNLDPNENIQFEFMPVAVLLEHIDNGDFPHALHIASVLMALRLL